MTDVTEESLRQENKQKVKVREKDIWPELIRTYDEYVNLIGEECDELATSAINRGWRSTRVEEGKRLRDKITELKSKL